MPATQRKCIYRGLTLDVDRRYIGSVTATTHQKKRHNNTWVEPLAGNCITSSTRQREQVWQKCKIRKNWCTVTVAPTIGHHGGHSRAPANQRWDQTKIQKHWCTTGYNYGTNNTLSRWQLETMGEIQCPWGNIDTMCIIWLQYFEIFAVGLEF